MGQSTLRATWTGHPCAEASSFGFQVLIQIQGNYQLQLSLCRTGSEFSAKLVRSDLWSMVRMTVLDRKFQGTGNGWQEPHKKTINMPIISGNHAIFEQFQSSQHVGKYGKKRAIVILTWTQPPRRAFRENPAKANNDTTLRHVGNSGIIVAFGKLGPQHH